MGPTLQKRAEGGRQRPVNDFDQRLQPFILPPSSFILAFYGPKRRRYSMDEMNAFTISAVTKLPFAAFNFANQKS